MLDLIHRERAVRGDMTTGQARLPISETWEALDFSEPCGFTVGRVVGARGRHRWNCRTDSPHAMLSGSTGTGKSQVLAQWAPLPDLWNHHHGTDWGETWIFDPKGTGIYRAAQNLGALLIDDMRDMVEALREIRSETQSRNRQLGQMQSQSVDASGIIHEGAEVSIWDLSQEHRLALDLRPRFIVFDEIADLLDPDPEDFPRGAFDRGLVPSLVSGFSHFARKGRSAGLVGAIGNQRMDVKFIGSGLTREQFASRIVLGSPSNDHYRMMFSDADAKLIPSEDPPLTPGHGWSINVGGRGLARMYATRVKLKNYEPLDRDRTFKAYHRDPLTEGPPAPELDEQAKKVWAYLLEHPDSTRRQVHEATGIPKDTLEKHLLNEKHGLRRHRLMFIETKKGGRGVASEFAAAPLPDPPQSSPPRRGETRGVWGEEFGFGVVRAESWWWGFGQDVRAVMTGWAVRWFLYFWAFRLLWGEAHSGANKRDRRVVVAAHAAGKGRCVLCGRKGELDVHHVRPLSFGGKDVLKNTWLVCKRPGKPSCHQATTTAEAGIRAIRRITVTLDGAKAPALHKRITPWLAVVYPFVWVFAGVYILGRMFPGKWWIAAIVLFFVGLVPLLFKYAMRGARAIPNQDYAVDPSMRPQAFHEQKKGRTMRRKFWGWYLINFHGRNEKWTARRRWTLQASWYFVIGAFTPKIIAILPALLLGILGVIL